MVLLLLLMVFIAGTCAVFVRNDYDKPLSFTCPRHQSISSLHSHHSNHHEDRKWALHCRRVPGVSHGKTEYCYKTSYYVNDWDKPIEFTCVRDYYITGIYSVHNNHYEDRRWRFRCCTIPSLHMGSCSSSGWVNSYDGDLAYHVPENHVLTGVHSVHNDHYEDRIFSFRYCCYPASFGAIPEFDEE